MERALYFHIHFQMLSLMLLVKIVVYCYVYLTSLRLLMTINAYLLPPFLAAKVVQSTEMSFIFINPEEYPCDTREFIIIFPCTFDTPFLVSLLDCLLGTVLGKHVHPPPLTITSRKNNRRYFELPLIITLFFKSHSIPVELISKEYFLSL